MPNSRPIASAVTRAGNNSFTEDEDEIDFGVGKNNKGNGGLKNDEDKESVISQMPKSMTSNAYILEFSGIEIDSMTMDALRESFRKFLPSDTPGEAGDRMEPGYMKMQYEKLGLNR